MLTPATEIAPVTAPEAPTSKTSSSADGSSHTTAATAPVAVSASGAVARVQEGLAQLTRSCELCTALVELDQIRAKSWIRRVQALKLKINSFSISEV